LAHPHLPPHLHCEPQAHLLQEQLFTFALFMMVFLEVGLG